MNSKLKRFVLGALSLSMVISTMLTPAFATSYTYEGESPGESWHQSTSTDENYNANNGQIVVGTDGTISSGTTGNVASGPLSQVTTPVGEYPDAYDFATDVDIANNSVFPNELGPTTQNEKTYQPTFISTVESGALPTGNSYTWAPALSRYSGYSVYRNTTAGVYNTSIAYTGTGLAYGTAPSITGMPRITKGGAIGRISIPSLGLNRYVYEGTSLANMNKGLAHFDCTSGWLGNVAVAGHNRGTSSSLHNIKNIQHGAKITYTTAYGTMTYQVTSVKAVSVYDTSGLAQDGTNKLTIYSCVENQPSLRLCIVATPVG